jgi:ribonuclease BN (tRNA processing enzyme)
MTEIIFLGVGGAMAVGPASNHTALLISDPEATILLDCGPAIMTQLEEAEVDLGQLTHVFVSHQHGDHSLGLPMLLLNRVLFWPDLPLTVLGTPPVLQLMAQLVPLAYPDLTELFDSLIRFYPLDVGPQALPLPGAPSITSRLAPGRHSVPTWGLRLTFPSGRSLVYSSDTGPSRHITALAQGADVLIHETFYVEASQHNLTSHSCALSVGRLASEANVDTLILVHRQDTRPSAAERYRAAASQHFAGPILVPEAGERFSL